MTALFRPLSLLLVVVAFGLGITVQLGLHADLRHLDEAAEARSAVQNCKDVLHFHSALRNQEMFVCLLENGRAAITIILTGYKAWDNNGEVTAFITKRFDTVEKTVEYMQYYINRTIAGDAYGLLSGNAPEWIQKALEGVK